MTPLPVLRTSKFANVRVLALSDTCIMHQAIEERVLSCEHCYERLQVRRARSESVLRAASAAHVCAIPARVS